MDKQGIKKVETLANRPQRLSNRIHGNTLQYIHMALGRMIVTSATSRWSQSRVESSRPLVDVVASFSSSFPSSFSRESWKEQANFSSLILLAISFHFILIFFLFQLAFMYVHTYIRREAPSQLTVFRRTFSPLSFALPLIWSASSYIYTPRTFSAHSILANQRRP